MYSKLKNNVIAMASMAHIFHEIFSAGALYELRKVDARNAGFRGFAEKNNEILIQVLLERGGPGYGSALTLSFSIKNNVSFVMNSL